MRENDEDIEDSNVTTKETIVPSAVRSHRGTPPQFADFYVY